MQKSTAAAAMVMCILGGSISAEPLVLEAQDVMYAMSVDVGRPDGDAGKRTLAGLTTVLGSEHNVVSADVVEQLYKKFIDRHKAATPVNWEYKAAEIEISGNNPAIFDGLQTLSEFKETGFNVVTLNFHCDNGPKIDESAPENYPWERHLGCSLGYNILDGSSKEALKVYIEEAKRLGLKVNLKPMFLGLAMNTSIYGYSDRNVQVNEFLYGSEPKWDGYVPRILRIAKLAESYGVEYLTIGTEFGNLNPKLMLSDDWTKIIADVRQVYSGKLVYSHNFGGDGTVKELNKMRDFVEQIDILGINYFPPLVMNGAKIYTVEEAASGLENFKADGKSLGKFLEDYAQQVPTKIVMSEVSFPTWRGNINWMFRHTCDTENAGKSGWEYTKGPLAPKEPSVAASLVLAAAWYETFADKPWVYGASHVFWHSTWVDDPRGIDFITEIGIKQCGQTLYENDYVRTIVSSYYN